MTTTLIGEKLFAYMDSLRRFNPMITLKKKPSPNTRNAFYGKRITLEQAMETTHRLVEYFDALKIGRPLPQKPDQALGYLLRCNAIVSLHYTAENAKLRGIGYRNWALTNDQVVYTWLYAHKLNLDKPVITLNRVSLRFQMEPSDEN